MIPVRGEKAPIPEMPRNVVSSATGLLGRWLAPALKWTLFALVVVFVARRAAALWSQQDLAGVTFEAGWLVPAALVYVVGWLPSVWFWHALLKLLGGEVRVADTARAYYCGHLGKYVPGKAAVLVIRSALLKDRGSRAGPAALTAAYETLVMMGAGAAVALVLTPVVVRGYLADGWASRAHGWPGVPWLPSVLVVGLCVLLLPVISRLLTYFAAKMARQADADSAADIRIGTKFLAAGVLVFVVAWGIQGLSLGLTLQAVSETRFTLGDWPFWTAAVCAASVLGFVAVFAPGGLGVREGVLIEMLRLHPDIGPQAAVTAAVLLRLAWLAAEILAAAVLYYAVRPPTHHPGHEKPADR